MKTVEQRTRTLRTVKVGDHSFRFVSFLGLTSIGYPAAFHNKQFVADRDLNAALNILRILLALLFGVRPGLERHRQLRRVFRQVRRLDVDPG